MTDVCFVIFSWNVNNLHTQVKPALNLEQFHGVLMDSHFNYTLSLLAVMAEAGGVAVAAGAVGRDDINYKRSCKVAAAAPREDCLCLR